MARDASVNMYRGLGATSRPAAVARLRPPGRVRSHEPSAVELKVAALPDEQQQVFWCLDLADEHGLADGELLEMLCWPSDRWKTYHGALDGLRAAGLIEAVPGVAPDAPRRWRLAVRPREPYGEMTGTGGEFRRSWGEATEPRSHEATK